MPEAPMERLDAGLVPAGEGWFIVNARDAAWMEAEGMGRFTSFEGPDVRFPHLGFGFHVLEPGEPSARYHAEGGQEGFLVVSGECTLVVEGEERTLRQWDYFYCAPWTEHITVGAGDGPCVLLMVGTRTVEGVRYPVSAVAARYGASVETETTVGKEAYAGLPAPVWAPYREGDLP
jgi:uncharacterized cupin superfamily protein